MPFRGWLTWLIGLLVALLLTLGDGVVDLLGAGRLHRLVALLGDGAGDVLHLRHVRRLGGHHVVLLGDVLRLVLGLVLGGHRRLNLKHNKTISSNSIAKKNSKSVINFAWKVVLNNIMQKNLHGYLQRPIQFI